MDETLRVELNSNHSVYTDSVYLTWIVPGTINLIINNRYIRFDFKQNCFMMEKKQLYCISIENQLRPYCVDVKGARGGWGIDCEEFGKFQTIVFTNNVVLAQYKTTKPNGRVIGIIEPCGIYTPEAQSFEDEDNRFDCLRFEKGGRPSKIWKVR